MLQKVAERSLVCLEFISMWEHTIPALLDMFKRAEGTTERKVRSNCLEIKFTMQTCVFTDRHFEQQIF